MPFPYTFPFNFAAFTNVAWTANTHETYYDVHQGGSKVLTEKITTLTTQERADMLTDIKDEYAGETVYLHEHDHDFPSSPCVLEVV